MYAIELLTTLPSFVRSDTCDTTQVPDFTKVRIDSRYPADFMLIYSNLERCTNCTILVQQCEQFVHSDSILFYKLILLLFLGSFIVISTFYVILVRLYYLTTHHITGSNISYEVGTGDNNKLNWAIEDKQEVSFIVACRKITLVDLTSYTAH